MYELQKKKKNWPLRILVFVLCLSITAELLRFVFKGPTLQESMVQAADEINKHCPVHVDSTTILTNAMALPGNQFVFNYTLLGVDKTNFDTVLFKNGTKTWITNTIKTNPSFKNMRQEGVVFNTRYADSTNNYLCSVIVGPWDYK